MSKTNDINPAKTLNDIFRDIFSNTEEIELWYKEDRWQVLEITKVTDPLSDIKIDLTTSGNIFRATSEEDFEKKVSLYSFRNVLCWYKIIYRFPPDKVDFRPEVRSHGQVVKPTHAEPDNYKEEYDILVSFQTLMEIVVKSFRSRNIFTEFVSSHGHRFTLDCSDL